MTTTLDRLHWAEQKEAELAQMEWDWRRLDEREGMQPKGDDLSALAKGEKEREAGRLQAELAVASFVERFYVAKHFESGRALLDRLGDDACIAQIATHDDLERFVRAEIARLANPNLITYWGWPTSRPAALPDHWWVDLPAVVVEDERVRSWEQYRFHVAGARVTGWLAGPGHEIRSIG